MSVTVFVRRLWRQGCAYLMGLAILIPAAVALRLVAGLAGALSRAAWRGHNCCCRWARAYALWRDWAYKYESGVPPRERSGSGVTDK